MKILKNKTAKNAFWLIGEKIFNLILTLVTLSLIARYFGPELYGEYNLAIAFVSLFIIFSTLGLENVVVKHIVQKKESEGRILLTSLVMRLVGSFLLIFISIIGTLIFYPGNDVILFLAFLISISYLFQAFGVLEYWAQSYQKSRITALVRMTVQIISSIFKILIVYLELELIYLAINLLLDTILVALGFIYVYRKYRDDKSKWEFKYSYMKSSFSESWYFIISGVMVAIYTQADKIILGSILSNVEVGIYVAAIALSKMWVFVPQAVITSMQPIIMNYKKTDEIAYYKSIEKLYSLILIISMSFAVIIIFIDDLVINILYGSEFSNSAEILIISIWAVGFSLLGVARNIWLLCEGIQKYMIYFLGIGAILSVLLNFILIPLWGAIGAAYTWLIVEILTALIVPLFFKATRKNSILILKACTFKSLMK